MRKRLALAVGCAIIFSFSARAQSSSASRPADLPGWITDAGARRAPKAKRTYLVNAAGDGVANATKAIQQAIDICARAGGGTVTFKPGNYISGALFLKSNVHLRVDTGVTLIGSQDDADYPSLWTRVAGIEMKWPAALINVNGQRNVKISGGGTIDGNGKKWWDKYWAVRRDYEPRGLRWASDYDAERVRLMVIWKSSDVTIENLSLKRSGFWTLQVVYSDHVTVDRIKITDNTGPSTDGVDIDSSRYVLVQNCDIDNNDDDICLKAGRDYDGLRVNRPTEYVVIRDNVTRRGGGIISFGSETSGGIRKVVAYNNRGIGTNEGIRFKSAKTRGGYVEDVLIRDLKMENVPLPFSFTLNWNPSYSYATIPKDVANVPPHWIALSTKVEPPERGFCEFRNIRIENVEIVNAGQIFSVKGLPEKPIVNVSFANVMAQGIDAGSIEYARNWTMRNVRLRTKSPLNLANTQDVQTPEILDPNAPEPTSVNPKLPTIFVVGDSTANNHTNEALGWGDPFIAYFDVASVNVLNRARAGRSSRTFITEGLWDNVLNEMKKGDVVLIQFGHNDGGPVNDATRARGSLPGLGEETEDIDNLLTKKHEVVHTYGWYLRKMIADTRAKGAVPVVLSLTVRNIWKDGRVERGSGRFGQWAAEVARAQNVEFIDLTTIVADRYEQLGQERVQALFGQDHTHTSPAGAELNAELVVAGLKRLKHCEPCKHLSAKGRAVESYQPTRSNISVVRSVVDVWPKGKMPGHGASEPEQERPPQGDGIQRITNVSDPTLTLFPVPKKGAPAPAMIVCPGGAYNYVVHDKEGTEIAAWLNSAGIGAFVLKYRVPQNRDGALKDLQRALSIARAHATEWNIDPKRLGVIGFSAGGDLAARASTLFNQRSYAPLDAVDHQSCRPDFAVLIYPAYLEVDGHVAADLNVKAKIPPTLIVSTEDDDRFVLGCKIYHAALDEAKVSNEFLLYPNGGHGYGLRSDKAVRVWPQAALSWLHKIGIR